MPADDANDATPTQWRSIGRYELGPRIAAGGMAELYVARTSGVHGFRKYLAIKRILPRFTDDREFVEMFLDEARLAAQLDHPNVVQVHDIGEDDDGPFFTMDYIHGQNLLAITRRLRTRGTPVPWDAYVALAAAAAAGLHHAHDRRGFDGRPLGLIHRDVSPTNILVTFEGAVKIVDFGIAKASTSRHSTRPSVRKGKIAYMSPEQCKGDTLDRRSDVFALGVVLFELVTLRRAFTGDGEFAIMNRIVNHDLPPPSSLRPDVPAALDRILMRAVARDPEARHGSARELQRDLEEFAVDEGLVATPQALTSLMEELFGASPYPWQSAEQSVPSEIEGHQGDTEPTSATRAAKTKAAAHIETESPSVDAPTSIRPVSEPSVPRPGPRRPWVLGGLGVASLAAVAWLAIPRSETADSSTPATTPELPAAPVPPAKGVPTASIPSGDAAPPSEPIEPNDSSTPPETVEDAPAQPAPSEPTDELPPTTKSSRRSTKPARLRPEPTTSESSAPALPQPFDPDAPAPRVR